MAEARFSVQDDFPPVSYEAWRELVEQDLKGAPFEKKLVTRLYEGLDIQPVYTARDWDGSGDPTGFAGLPPFTRGSHSLGGSLCGWDIRQECNEPEPEAANEAILEDLERGVTSVHLRLDAAARRGVDLASPEAAELAGRDGVMCYTVDDLDRVLRDVKLSIAAFSLEAGAAFLPAAAQVVALWDRRGDPRGAVAGAFNADPLAVLARDGHLPMPLETAMSQMTELASFASAELPRVTAVRVGTAPYHHAGATAAQDLALSMATGVEYLRAMTGAGLSVDQAARQTLFSYAVGCNFFLAIAKLRAARRMWARVVTASGGSEAAASMRMHVRTSKRVLTQRDPWVNLLRGTATTFAAAVAGAETITAPAFDSAIGTPDGFSRRIARNTQLILNEESNLHRVVDPAGGSWFIEKLTSELAESAWAIFQDIERGGGMAQALTSGWVSQQIDSAFVPRAKNLATRRDAVTGVSEFPNLAEKAIEKSEPDYATLVFKARERTGGGESGRVESAESALAGASAGGRVAAAVEAAAAGAAVSGMVRALAGDGEAASMAPLSPHPYAAPFERLRDASDAYEAMCGRRPRVFLANMGPIAHHTARAAYARNFFEAGGFEVETNNGFADAESAGEAFSASGANVAVVCSSDKLYPEMVPQVAPALKRAGARAVLLAGHPGENEEAYRAAGVDRFIFIKCDVLGTLTELLTEEGVLS